MKNRKYIGEENEMMSAADLAASNNIIRQMQAGTIDLDSLQVDAPPPKSIRVQIQQRSTADIAAEINYHQTVQKMHSPQSTAWKDRSKKLSALFNEMARRS